MLWGVFQTLLISIGIIWGIHLLIQYLQETCTVKKNKDMLSIVTKKYEKMLDDVVTCHQTQTQMQMQTQTQGLEPTMQMHTQEPFVQMQMPDPTMQMQTQEPFVQMQTQEPFVQMQTQEPFVQTLESRQAQEVAATN